MNDPCGAQLSLRVSFVLTRPWQSAVAEVVGRGAFAFLTG
jgi:hypothetical protein